MTLYKYSSAKWGIAILRDLRLKVSPPNSFNDPFEFTPQTLNPLKDVKSAYAVFQRNGLPCSFDCFQEKLWPRLCQDAQLKEQFVRENISDDLNEKDKASEFVGVLCLSQSPDDIRMWSHYAQNHTGITIGLDVSNSSFRKAKIIDEVNYAVERATWDFLPKPNTKGWFKQVANVALTKSKHWREENEYRVIFRLQDLKKERIQPESRQSCNRPHRKNDEFTFFTAIRADAVQEVFMGCRISEGDVWEIKNILEQKFPSARLFQMKRHDTKFKLISVCEKSTT